VTERSATPEPALRLRKPLERALREGHPWVYRDAVQPSGSAGGELPAGVVARLIDAKGRFVARGITDAGPIALRVFTLRDESVGASLFASRVNRAAELRDRVLPPSESTDAYRLLHGEGDRLPGFVCDVYGPFAVLKTDGAGALAHWPTALEALVPALEKRGVDTVLRREGGRTSSAKQQGEPRAVRVHGAREVPAAMTVREHGMALRVDLLHGQKTGLFLDQRESRAKVRSVARGLRVLNLYSYTGGFSVAAGLGGAKAVTSVDIAPGAIALAQETWGSNGLAEAAHETVVADVPAWIQQATKERRRFDLVIADPPSFAPNDASVPTALKSYRALHAACLGLVASGGWYLAGSCSSHVTREMFVDSLEESAGRAGKVLQVIDAWGAPGDHPRLLAFPEGDYLKNVLMRVTD
jgi:23S rRNA (cytosine1962-C5)-methyltransferase